MGYTTGGPKLKSKDTRLEVVTEGILLLRPDESFQGIKYVVLDEVHERGLNLDLLFLKFKKLLEKYSELRLIVMSATLDPEKFGKYFNDTLGETRQAGGIVARSSTSSFAEIEGTTANMDMKWPTKNIDNYPETIIDTIKEITTSGGEKGNILVFLPTRAMISEVKSKLTRTINEFDFDHEMHGLVIAELYSGIGSQGEDLAKLHSMSFLKYSALVIKTNTQGNFGN